MGLKQSQSNFCFVFRNRSEREKILCVGYLLFTSPDTFLPCGYLLGILGASLDFQLSTGLTTGDAARRSVSGQVEVRSLGFTVPLQKKPQLVSGSSLHAISHSVPNSCFSLCPSGLRTYLLLQFRAPGTAPAPALTTANRPFIKLSSLHNFECVFFLLGLLSIHYLSPKRK